MLEVTGRHHDHLRQYGAVTHFESVAQVNGSYRRDNEEIGTKPSPITCAYKAEDERQGTGIGRGRGKLERIQWG